MKKKGIKTLAEARAYLRRVLHQRGHVRCPCCDLKHSIHEIHLDQKLVNQLEWFVKAAGENESLVWVDVPKQAPAWMIRSRTYNRLRYFGLLERKDYVTKLSPERKGCWRPTNKGVLFMRGDHWTHEWVRVYQGKVVQKAAKLIGVDIARGTVVHGGQNE